MIIQIFFLDLYILVNISCETSVFKKLGLRRALNTRRYSWWENTRRRQSYPVLYIGITHSWD